MKNLPLIVICGATASGKSALALEIAQKLNTVIISADSRQVYQDFNIGTAKPSLAEQQLIPHYLIDICLPTETLTLADYQTRGRALINPDSPTPVLLVGGTGLYIKSITKGLKIPRVSPQPELRQSLLTYSQKERYDFLSTVDPVAVTKIHPHDETRTIRALEVYYVTGKPISEQQGESPPDYPILQIGLTGARHHLHERIKIRTKQMLQQGLIDEVKFLIDKYGADLPLLNTLGYAEIKAYLGGKLSRLEAEELIVTHTRQFAKRQETWFRAYPEIHWFDVDNPHLYSDVWRLIQVFLS